MSIVDAFGMALTLVGALGVITVNVILVGSYRRLEPVPFLTGWAGLVIACCVAGGALEAFSG